MVAEGRRSRESGDHSKEMSLRESVLRRSSGADSSKKTRDRTDSEMSKATSKSRRSSYDRRVTSTLQRRSSIHALDEHGNGPKMKPGRYVTGQMVAPVEGSAATIEENEGAKAQVVRVNCNGFFGFYFSRTGTYGRHKPQFAYNLLLEQARAFKTVDQTGAALRPKTAPQKPAKSANTDFLTNVFKKAPETPQEVHDAFNRFKAPSSLCEPWRSSLGPDKWDPWQVTYMPVKPDPEMGPGQYTAKHDILEKKQAVHTFPKMTERKIMPTGFWKPPEHLTKNCRYFPQYNVTTKEVRRPPSANFRVSTSRDEARLTQSRYNLSLEAHSVDGCPENLVRFSPGPGKYDPEITATSKYPNSRVAGFHGGRPRATVVIRPDEKKEDGVVDLENSDLSDKSEANSEDEKRKEEAIRASNLSAYEVVKDPETGMFVGKLRNPRTSGSVVKEDSQSEPSETPTEGSGLNTPMRRDREKDHEESKRMEVLRQTLSNWPNKADDLQEPVEEEPVLKKRIRKVGPPPPVLYGKEPTPPSSLGPGSYESSEGLQVKRSPSAVLDSGPDKEANISRTILGIYYGSTDSSSGAVPGPGFYDTNTSFADEVLQKPRSTKYKKAGIIRKPTKKERAASQWPPP